MLQDFSDKLNLEVQRIEKNIEDYRSILIQFRNGMLAVVAFVATLILGLASVDMINRNSITEILVIDVSIGVLVYFGFNIIIAGAQKPILKVWAAFARALEVSIFMKSNVGVSSFYLEKVTIDHLYHLQIYITILMNSQFGIVNAYSNCSKSKFWWQYKAQLCNLAENYKKSDCRSI